MCLFIKEDASKDQTEKKRSSSSKDPLSPPKKKKQHSIIDVELPNAPVDGEWPFRGRAFSSMLPFTNFM